MHTMSGVNGLYGVLWSELSHRIRMRVLERERERVFETYPQPTKIRESQRSARIGSRSVEYFEGLCD